MEQLLSGVLIGGCLGLALMAGVDALGNWLGRRQFKKDEEMRLLDYLAGEVRELRDLQRDHYISLLDLKRDLIKANENLEGHLFSHLPFEVNDDLEVETR